MITDIEEQTKSACNLPRGITQEAASENPDVRAIIRSRIQTLTDISNSFLNTIIQSLDQVPYGIRWICKQIKYLTKRKYPDYSEFSICSLIGGFFFLRFLNPAIVTPQSHMLVDSAPGNNPRRTLTLVAKVLQNLSNKPSYVREKYMVELHPFVEANKDRVTNFLLDLCEVGDFYEALEMDQYIALSKKEIQLNITLNEMYNTQALLLEHIDVLSPDSKQHLRICLTDLGPAPAQLPRSENKSVVLPLFSRWETSITETPSAISDSQLTQGDILYMDSKAIFVQIMRSMPHIANQRQFDLNRIAEAAATSRDAALVKKGLKVREMLTQLEVMGIVDKNSGYHLMVEEVTQELVHLGNLRELVTKETKSLEIVYKTIIDHNNYLRSQLELFKLYLGNALVVSGSSKPDVKTKVPVKFTHAQLEKDGIIVESNVPENRSFNFLAYCKKKRVYLSTV
ncbi:glyceraldehyde-3-phosphate dehydrogenase 1 [Nowakowskiella sp. JEL0078]|nr:glyceraldehyde-3-phosphate dehydrogenase 1 [Nowakowskiella sp. JEL0078]